MELSCCGTLGHWEIIVIVEGVGVVICISFGVVLWVVFSNIRGAKIDPVCRLL